MTRVVLKASRVSRPLSDASVSYDKVWFERTKPIHWGTYSSPPPMALDFDLGNSQTERVRVTIGTADFDLLAEVMMRHDREAALTAFRRAMVKTRKR